MLLFNNTPRPSSLCADWFAPFVQGFSFRDFIRLWIRTQPDPGGFSFLKTKTAHGPRGGVRGSTQLNKNAPRLWACINSEENYITVF